MPQDNQETSTSSNASPLLFLDSQQGTIADIRFSKTCFEWLSICKQYTKQ